MKCLLQVCTEKGLRLDTNPQEDKYVKSEGILASTLADPFVLYIGE